ncbi:hypothetical protein IOLA_189 [uncultured bacterium]|nr:hypothetical protein IOLA_189 [uncultured bacterium]
MSIKLIINLNTQEIKCKIHNPKTPKILNCDIKKDIVIVDNVSMYKYSEYTDYIVKNSVFNNNWIKFIYEEEKNINKNIVCKYPKSLFNRHIYFLNNHWCIIKNISDNINDQHFLFIPTKSINFNLLSAVMNIDYDTCWNDAKSELINAYSYFLSNLEKINSNISPNNLIIQFNSIHNQHISSLHGHFIFKK